MAQIAIGVGRCIGRLASSLALREIAPATVLSPQCCLRNLSSAGWSSVAGSETPPPAQAQANSPEGDAAAGELLEPKSRTFVHKSDEAQVPASSEIAPSAETWGSGTAVYTASPHFSDAAVQGGEEEAKELADTAVPPSSDAVAQGGEEKAKEPINVVPLMPKPPPPPEYEGESMVMEEIRLHNSSMWGLNGQIISGEVIAVGKEYVVVDMGFKSLSRFFKKELSTTQIYATTEDHKIKRKEGVFFVGDRLQFRIDDVESPYGDMSLTTHRLRDSIQKELVWKELVEAFQNNAHIQGRVLNPVDRGYAVGVGGFVCFCPINYLTPSAAQKIGVLQPFKIAKMSGPGERKSILVIGVSDESRPPTIRRRGMTNFGTGNTWAWAGGR